MMGMGAFTETRSRLLWPPALALESEGILEHTGHTPKSGPALGAPHTCVWIRFRPRNHRIWPRRSSRSAWSISSTSSFNSSSGISSFCVSRPASFRNLSLLVGMVAMTCKGCTGQRSGLRTLPPLPPLPPPLPSFLSHMKCSLFNLPPVPTQLFVVSY